MFNDYVAYRQTAYAKKMKIFEIAYPTTSLSKQERVKRFCKKSMGNPEYLHTLIKRIIKILMR